MRSPDLLRARGTGKATLLAVTVEALTPVGLLVWGGATLFLDVWLSRRRYRPSLTERLAPFSGRVSDEAERWLRGRQ